MSYLPPEDGDLVFEMRIEVLVAAFGCVALIMKSIMVLYWVKHKLGSIIYQNVRFRKKVLVT